MLTDTQIILQEVGNKQINSICEIRLERDAYKTKYHHKRTLELAAHFKCPYYFYSSSLLACRDTYRAGLANKITNIACSNNLDLNYYDNDRDLIYFATDTKDPDKYEEEFFQYCPDLLDGKIIVLEEPWHDVFVNEQVRSPARVYSLISKLHKVNIRLKVRPVQVDGDQIAIRNMGFINA